ncbi:MULTISPECIES: YbhB/YbcL family Raf kinase inhibitor-like protein [Cyanophyceae]|uniref:YbhB/YbcL family Raf kinase inhibitor-like protein n=1 Tax=Cyanophyceae TaxID=3028117 RepID=UPI0016836E2C|nr:YbhB/YbcL family Raf kinase inhibitor-like protein [Trichocoleus sp. FACHB-40]MBD2002934.1 YbhB/YbcL family Raf kinase inhibitor-like protein [Trichocoleus sp. FACHB-40]
MKLKSTAFSADGLIPSKYTCDGADISPPLSWTTPPTGTESLALIVDDPDAPAGIFVHWVLYDLPAEILQLPEAVSTEANVKYGGSQGKNDFGNLGYGGPCPPSGTHRYFFRLYALNRVLDLASGVTKSQLEAAMDGHILAAAELMGRYSRNR